MDPATRLLEQVPFDRVTSHMLRRVLEEGWALLQPRLGGRSTERAARLNVADGILAMAKAGHRDPEALKLYAVSRALTLL